MPTYLVGYDLRAGENYAALENAIRRIATAYSHELDSTWIVVYPGNAATLRNQLLPYLTNHNQPASQGQRAGDKLLVAELKGTAAWTASFGRVVQDFFAQYLPLR